ncbi:amidase [Liquorilactobacillus nagelii]|jgi:amidase|uniref:amidase n=1 Tax=Liquorilactobacillus nagelii TaxID=82688 RepID=UPI003C6D0C2E
MQVKGDFMGDSQMDLLLKPAYKLAELVRQKKLSSVELIDLTFRKLSIENPNLNAVIATRKSAALLEAKQLQDTGQPFLGVPILLKGLGQSLKGEPETYGNRLFKTAIANSTNNYVRALQKAGFIVIGQTNFPEFGFKNINDAKIFGPAHNPWNLNYQPGGSSGGAAAAVAAGILPLAAGNDGGGSIRIPASWSGTIGLKPTRGRVPTGPIDWRSWQGASVNFALTRSVADTALLLDALQTVQPAAVFQVPLNLDGFFKNLVVPATKTVIGYTAESPVGTPVSAAAKQAVADAVAFLNSQGFATSPIKLPTNGVELMKSYYLMNEAETAAMFANLQQLLGRSLTRNDMEPLAWALYQTGKNVSAAKYSQSLNSWDAAAYQMAELHKKYPVILTPTTATVAPLVNQPLVNQENLSRMEHAEELTVNEQQQLIWNQWLPSLKLSPFTQQANLTGAPAISLPTEITSSGLPLGIQLTAGKGQEQLLLQFATLFEKEGQLKFLHPTNFTD